MRASLADFLIADLSEQSKHTVGFQRGKPRDRKCLSSSDTVLDQFQSILFYSLHTQSTHEGRGQRGDLGARVRVRCCAGGCGGYGGAVGARSCARGGRSRPQVECCCLGTPATIAPEWLPIVVGSDAAAQSDNYSASKRRAAPAEEFVAREHDLWHEVVNCATRSCM